MADSPDVDASDGIEDLPPTVAAARLLESVRYEKSPEPYLASLAAADEGDLERIRSDRHASLAFWLNVYNAGAQLLLERRPTLYDSRVRFFRATAATVAGTDLSLDDVEHGILRGGRSKYGLGYLPRLARTGLSTAYRLCPLRIDSRWIRESTSPSTAGLRAALQF